MMPGTIDLPNDLGVGNDAYTTLLLHMNYNYVDSCKGATPHIFQPQNTTPIFNSQAKFGGGSAQFGVQWYLNGAKDGAAVAFTAQCWPTGGTPIIGRPGDFNGLYYPGHIDEFRLSFIPRWKANFTPPAAAYTT